MFVLMDDAELRRCGRCHELKAIDQFNWRRRERGQRDNMCRPCRAAYNREHYLKNKQRYIDQAHERKRRARTASGPNCLLDVLRRATPALTAEKRTRLSSSSTT